jgi:hypothetical protein
MFDHFLGASAMDDVFYIWISIFAVLPGLFLAVWPKLRSRTQVPFLVLGGFTLIACLVGFLFNGDNKMNDACVGLMATAIFAGEARREAGLLRVSPGWNAYLIVVCSMFAFSSFTQTAARRAVEGIGPGAFFELDMEDSPLQAAFFKGMRAGHNLHVTVDAINALCASHSTQNIYFGPRLQWAYAAFHIPSPKGMPIWWHPTTAFDPRDEDLLTERWIENRYDPIVFMDFSFLNARFVNDIVHSYVVEKSYPLNPDAGSLLIMSLKK